MRNLNKFLSFEVADTAIVGKMLLEIGRKVRDAFPITLIRFPLFTKTRSSWENSRKPPIFMKVTTAQYREVHLVFTPEMKVCNMLFERCPTKNTMISLEQQIR